MDQPVVTHQEQRSWFWPIQIVAWILVGLINFAVQATVPSIRPVVLYLNLLGMAGGGMLVTSLYRLYLKNRGIRFSFNGKFVGFLLLSTFIISICWLLTILLIFLPVLLTTKLNFLQYFSNLIPLSLIVLLWVLFYLLYQLTTQYHVTEVEKWKLEAEVQKAQLGALKSQINPHFMFNALNNIRALILEDQQQARLMLTKFAEIFRYALQHSEERETTVAEELNILQQFLELVKIQYEEKLRYNISADEDVKNEKIPPMILQLLVENAVKHGIALSPTGGEINVQVIRENDLLILSVKNTGTLQHNNQLEESLGIGLKNVSERLKLLYNDNASLTMQEQAPFVMVTISIKRS